ncbi:MAG: hypothetical protein AAF384_07755 [Pseudomonadota bacterium]
MNDERTTAYRSNTRLGSGSKRVCEHGWSENIARLVVHDFAFLKTTYCEGFLFRGLANGAAAARECGSFGISGGTHTLNRLEADLNVVLVSAHASDALSVAAPWVNPDGAIVVIPAKVFQEKYRHGEAATLGFAEPGMMFHYPCFAEPIALADLVCIIAAPCVFEEATSVQNLDRHLLESFETQNNRERATQQFEAILLKRGLVGAPPVRADRFPRLAESV